jgi:hypothetical protein
MKLFTLKEADDLIPIVRPKLEKIKIQYRQVASLRESVKAAAMSAELGGGGIENGSVYVKSLYEIGKITTELFELGIRLKDYSRGLIDFPSLRDERVILLCWQLGEKERIEWWHEEKDGFSGRKPL